MDIDLLKTFLEVQRTRHFGRAADNLYLTHSAVSARIRQLEETLGVPLFIRARHNIQLTPAGQRLVKHAEAMLNTWHRARQDLAAGEETRPALAIGGLSCLWEVLLQDWLHRLHRAQPALALTAEAHTDAVLIRRLLDGLLDVAFVFEPPRMAELLVSEIPGVRLTLVARNPDLTPAQATGPGYVAVDWGTSFAVLHARHFPDAPPPATRLGLNSMALAFLQECGGAAYLAASTVEAPLREGRLHGVAGAPVIERPAFAVFRERNEHQELVLAALELL